MKFNSQNIYPMIIAGVCGITGFFVSYWLLGLLVEPILNWYKARKGD